MTKGTQNKELDLGNKVKVRLRTLGGLGELIFTVDDEVTKTGMMSRHSAEKMFYIIKAMDHALDGEGIGISPGDIDFVRDH